MTYQRGGLTASIDKAVVGRTSFTESGGENVEVALTERDYLILASEIVIGGSVVDPEEGDTIAETVNGKVYTYAVLPPGGLGDAAVWSDPGQTTWRIHTQLDSVEDV